VRRYEYYKYAGNYDPVTHQALCADPLCAAPGPGELGDAIGAQNAAANLEVNALTVNVTGSGKVSSGDKICSCPSNCYGVYTPGSTVTLTAKANSRNNFVTWTGACVGNLATCTVTVDAESTVAALFAPVVARGGGGGGGTQFTLSVGRSNAGIVASGPDIPGLGWRLRQ
jgi:Divergent InlB B-repeat domain